ncbi:hypothetical protein OSF83_000946 [Enterococcus hirae]|uniref:hypothetical protein n=1 Tax=Enterococcus TaxID=1350 RepID=UPI0009BD3F9D|nr:hypothetical protein [Enterococcus hirae]HCE19491.1 hypothetical protein [Enterococcus sp.]EMF0052550.1 hypothetical protein [Enterococcus hirae]EMF0083732.1 hypothetical protein [Enterococcus hirae]EMF0102699.1 hypothetical protein [Enterococcus hirae]EMF0104958.1 hypothetical protein [Enterococcus hirae]
MKDFDSLGAMQEPPKESSPIGIDWQDNPIYEGDSCYLTEDGYVQEEDILEYVQQYFPKIELGGV